MNKLNIKMIWHSSWMLLCALVSGIVLSLVVPNWMEKFSFIGEIYLKLMELCVYPLVFLSISSSIMSFSKKTIKRDIRTYFTYWILTAGVLAALGVVCAYALVIVPNEKIMLKGYTGNAEISITNTILSAIPNNIVGAFISENILELIVLAIIFGIAANRVNLEEKNKVKYWVDAIYDIQKEVVYFLVSMLPIGVFFLSSRLVISNEISGINNIFKMVVAIYLGYVLVIFVVYPIIIKWRLKINYWTFLKKYYKPLIVAFISCSSSSAFPLVLNSAVDKKTNDTLAGIALILKHANCLQMPVYCIVIAKMCSAEISFSFIAISCILGVLSSIGTAGIPNGGVIMIAVVFKILNLPLEYVSIIAGIYVILDMPGTTINVLDDCLGLELTQRDTY